MKPDTRHSTLEARGLPLSVIAAGMVSAAVGFAAFVPALQNEFVYDDLPIIAYNPVVTQPGPWYRFWREPWWPRIIGSDRLYRPLTVWSFRANVVVPEVLGKHFSPHSPPTGPDPFWFHLVNLVLHGLTCTGVVLLAYRITGWSLAGWASGLLFAAHPIHTESVVTGYGRAELLAGLLGTWLLARYIRQPSQNAPGWCVRKLVTWVSTCFRARASGPPCTGETPVPHLQLHPVQRTTLDVRFAAVNTVLFAMALMSKEHALFVWPVMVLIDLWRRRIEPGAHVGWREWLNGPAGLSHAGFAMSAALFFFLRYQLFHWRYWVPRSELTLYQAPLANAEWTERLLTPLRLLWLSTELCFWPPKLCPIWSLPSLSLADRVSADVLGGMAVLAAILAGGLLLYRQRSLLGAMVLGTFVLLAVPLQFVAIISWFFAERWLYLPTVPAAVLAGAAIARLRGPGLILTVAIGALLLPASWSYSKAFRTNLEMIQAVLTRQPDNYQGMRSLGHLLAGEGDYAGALQASHALIARFGDVPEAYECLARVHWLLGDAEQAYEAVRGHDRALGDRISFALQEIRQEALKVLAAQEARTTQPSTRTATSAGEP